MVNHDVPSHFDDDFEEEDDQEVHDIPNNEEDIDEGKACKDCNFRSLQMSTLSNHIKLRLVHLELPKCTKRDVFRISNSG